MALFPTDVLFRRLRIGFLDRRHLEECLGVVCDVFGEELGWNEKEKNDVYKGELEKIKKMDL